VFTLYIIHRSKIQQVTSALDHESALRVERVVTGSGAVLVWVTHEDAQPLRVGGQALLLPQGTIVSAAPLPTSPCTMQRLWRPPVLLPTPACTMQRL
jgi:hypothetical protein